MPASTAVVIGGGVIGLSTAYHLARKSFGRIIVLDKGLIGEGGRPPAALTEGERDGRWMRC